MLLSGQYDDIIDEGDCYEVKKDGAHGFLDRHGKEVIPVSWSYASNHERYMAEPILSCCQNTGMKSPIC